MDAFVLARLGLGLLGVLAAVQGLTAFPRLAGITAQVTAQYGSSAAIVAVLLPFLLIWLVSYWLVFRNVSLARVLAARTEAASEAEAPAVLSVLVGLAGVLIVAYALPNLITYLWLIATQDSPGRNFTRATVAYVAQAGLGSALVFQPRRLLGFWIRPSSSFRAV